MTRPEVPKDGQDGNARMGRQMGTEDMPMGTISIPDGQMWANGRAWASGGHRKSTQMGRP